jgi:hypothetical protein
MIYSGLLQRERRALMSLISNTHCSSTWLFHTFISEIARHVNQIIWHSVNSSYLAVSNTTPWTLVSTDWFCITKAVMFIYLMPDRKHTTASWIRTESKIIDKQRMRRCENLNQTVVWVSTTWWVTAYLRFPKRCSSLKSILPHGDITLPPRSTLN